MADKRKEALQLTDAEIIKALEYCCGSIQNDCKDCPFGERCENDESLLRYAFDLVNRKTEEICVLYDALDGRDVEIMNLKHEIERLKAEIRNTDNALYALDRPLVEIKTEAYREFAERFNDLLKEYAPYDTFHIYEIKDRIDIVEDELTGGANNE